MARVLLWTGLWSGLFTGGGSYDSAEKARQLQQLQAAQPTVMIEGQHLTLDAYLWCNFMPMTQPAGHPVAGSLTRRNEGLEPFPPGVTAEQAWIINGEELWTTAELEVRQTGAQSPHLLIEFRDGPEWETGIKVDVVVQLRDTKQQPFLIKVDAREIKKIH